MLHLWYQTAALFWYRFFNLFTDNIRARIRMKKRSSAAEGKANEELSASPIKKQGFLILHSYYFLTNCHLRTVEYHDNRVERGGLDGGLHRFRVSIAVHLFYRLLLQLLYP